MISAEIYVLLVLLCSLNTFEGETLVSQFCNFVGVTALLSVSLCLDSI
jgi:hypothetical protein